MKFIAVALLFTASALPAGDPPGFHYWSSSELKSFARTLSPKINALKVASEPLASHGNYQFMAAHREGSGEAEYHETMADILVIESGECTLVYGGSMVKAKTTAPHEKRAPSIQGGLGRKLSEGDVVTIPAATPHQMLVPAGKQVTYFVVKVAQ